MLDIAIYARNKTKRFMKSKQRKPIDNCQTFTRTDNGTCLVSICKKSPNIS